MEASHFFDKKTVLKILLFALLALIFFLSKFVWDLTVYFDPERIQAILSRTGGFAPFVYMLVMAMAVVISPIPSLPLDITAGIFFGPILGTLYSSLGALGGASLSFLIARLLGREWIERFLGGHINFCTACSNKLLTKIVFFSRLLPVVSFDIISYGAGLTKMSLKHFCIATFLGMLPLTFLYNTLFQHPGKDPGLTIVLGLIMVILFLLVPRWIERNNLFSMSKLFQHPGKGPE